MPPAKQKLAPQKRGRAKKEAEEVEEDSDLPSDSGSDPVSGDESDSGDDSFPEVSDEDDEGVAGGSSDEDDDEDMEDDEEDAKEITVEFEFFSPEEKDFLGLKTLLTNYLNGDQFDSSGLVDAIIEEGDIGSVVKTDEDDDPIAVMTVLNTTQYKESAFMKQIKDFLVSRCTGSHAGLKQELTKAFDAPSTGLLINERLLNSPPKLGPPLLQFLMQEIKSSAEDTDDPDSVNYQYKRYILATRVYVDNGGAGSSGQEQGEPSTSRPHKKAKQGEGSKQSEQQQQLVFVRPEDEFLHQHSAWSLTCPVEGRPVTKDGFLAHRLIMMVEAEQVPVAQAEMDKVVGNMAAGVTVGADDGDEEEKEEEEQEPVKGGKGGASGSKGQKPAASKASKGSRAMSDVERMAADMFAQAAAAGAGKGAAGQSKKDKKKKKGAGVKAVTL